MTFALYLHLLAMATFVGGQLVLGLAVVPGLRGRDREGLRAVARRFGWMSLAALAVLLVDGRVDGVGPRAVVGLDAAREARRCSSWPAG